MNIKSARPQWRRTLQAAALLPTVLLMFGCAERPQPTELPIGVSANVPPPGALSSITLFELIPDSVVGGFGSAGGWVTIADPPPDTMVLLISSNNTRIAEVICPARFANAGPGTCVNPPNNTILDFVVDSHCIFEGCVGDGPPESATISVTYAGVQHDAVLRVYPNPNVEPPAQLESIFISPDTTVGGTDCCLKTFGEVWLTTVNYPDPTFVEVFSSHPSIVEFQDRKVNNVPGTVIFTRPCCANPRPRVAFFDLTTSEVTVRTLVTVTAEFQGVTRTASFTVVPPSPRRTLQSLALEKSTAIGGVAPDNFIRATLTPTGAQQYTDVATLSSSNPAAASGPASQTISWGATSAVFFVTTHTVTESTPVTITATMNGSTVTANLTVVPDANAPPPPPPPPPGAGPVIGASITAPSSIDRGQRFNIDVNVQNTGDQDLTGGSVSLTFSNSRRIKLESGSTQNISTVVAGGPLALARFGARGDKEGSLTITATVTDSAGGTVATATHTMTVIK